MPMPIPILNHDGDTLLADISDLKPGMVLSYGVFKFLQLGGVRFENCNLVGADFSGSYLAHAYFIGCDLTACYLPARLFAGNTRSSLDFTGSYGLSRPPIGWKYDDNGKLEMKSDGECHDCSEESNRDCGRCSDCCDHYQCSGCDECCDRGCDCDYCTDCCECTRCQNCSNLETCSDCESCDECCSCNNESGYNPKGPLPHPKNSKFACKRTVGVEWEFNEYVKLGDDWTKKWNGGLHEDGSCGWEAVTAPMSGDNIANVLHYLGDVFASTHAKANEDCGIHVHVDARDLSWSDMYRLLWVYGKLEPFLYLLAGQFRAKLDRSGGSYCKPIGGDFLAALSEIDRKGAVLALALDRDSNHTPEKIRESLRRNRPEKKDGGRYRGLNIMPWIAGRAYKSHMRTTDHGTGKKICYQRPANDTTVEFRMHRNTLDANRVIGWAQVCAKIVDWAANATDKEAQALPKSAFRALLVIAPECRSWILGRLRAWRKSTEVGQHGHRKVRRMIKYNPSVGYTLNV